MQPYITAPDTELSNSDGDTGSNCCWTTLCRLKEKQLEVSIWLESIIRGAPFVLQPVSSRTKPALTLRLLISVWPNWLMDFQAVHQLKLLSGPLEQNDYCSLSATSGSAIPDRYSLGPLWQSSLLARQAQRSLPTHTASWHVIWIISVSQLAWRKDSGHMRWPMPN